MNYYEILGIKPNCTEIELKKAYKQACVKHHPDRDQNDKNRHETTLKINEAFSVLSDPSKRTAYDRSLGFGVFRKSRSVTKTVMITLKESMEGCIATISLERTTDIHCNRCNASGCEPGGKLINCQVCSGSGKRIEWPMGQIHVAKCTTCLGKGYIVSATCISCQGHGKYREKFPVKIRLPPGVEHGSRATMSVNEDMMRKINLTAMIHIEEDKMWNREDLDIFVEIKATFLDAYIGFSTRIQTPIGEEIEFTFPPGSDSEMQSIVHGKGVRKDDRFGNAVACLKLTQMKHMNSKCLNISKEVLQIQRELSRALKQPIDPIANKPHKK